MPRKIKPCAHESFVLVDGEAIPTKSIPPEKWAEYEEKMMENAGRAMSDFYSARLAMGQFNETG